MEYKDLHDFIRQLTEDEMFIDWVRSDFALHDDQWSAFVDEHMDHMDAINEAIRMVRDLNFKPNTVLDTDALWSRIEKSAAIESKPKTKIINLKYLISIAAAACIALVVLTKFGFLSNGNTEINAPLAQITKEVLPDQSSVTMSPGTKLSYNASSWAKNRNIDLDGLAFFDVKKGETFSVQTTQGTVTVLGTSFSVDTRFGNFEVICKTGKVKVTDQQGNEKILNPGDMAKQQDGALVMTSAGTNTNVSWMSGTYTFENAPLRHVIAELENQYDIKVEVDPSILDQKYTGFFKTGNLNEALFSVTWPMKMKYEVNGSTIKIFPN